MKTIFIAGTDTGVGKTTFALSLLDELNTAGHKTFAFKPIATGGFYNTQNELQNEDALLLQHAASIKDNYTRVNPIIFRDPIAPHIAAQKENVTLTKKIVIEKINASIRHDADFNIIEGAGGICVPLNDHELYADVIVELKIPVILVVGIRLGCLNHAILTYDYMRSKNMVLQGWIANCIDPAMLAQDENIRALKKWIAAPFLKTMQRARLAVSDRG